jgi:hypothetical protein
MRPLTSNPGLSTSSALSVATIELHDPDGALRAAELADSGWASGDRWLYGAWSPIRIGAGIAYVMKGDIDRRAAQRDGRACVGVPHLHHHQPYG